MGSKPKSRDKRVKSMDAMLAKSRRDSEQPKAANLKFEVRDSADPSNADIDPRGWLFSGRPPSMDASEEASDDIRNAKFTVLDKSSGVGNEDPRGWLFSGRPPAKEEAAATVQKGREEVPAPVAKLDLVKKPRKKRRRSDEHQAVAVPQPPPAAPQPPPAAPSPPPTPPPAEVQAVEIEKVEIEPADPELLAPENDSDPTLQVATPSAEESELDVHSEVDFPDFDPPPQAPVKRKRSPLVLVTLLALLLASAAAWYGYSIGALDPVVGDPPNAQTNRRSRKLVAIANRIPKKVVRPATAEPANAEPANAVDIEKPVRAEEPTAEAVPSDTGTTVVEPMTAEQQALTPEERTKQARYLRSRGFRAIRKSDLDKAEDSFRESLQLYPSSSVSLRGLGETLALRGDADSARAWLERALRRNPADSKTQKLLDSLRAK